MITISLNGAEFFAFHGFYPEEQKLGSKFIVDVDVSIQPTGNLKEDDLNNTVDYEQLYEIVAEEMVNTRKLIETVAQSIADGVKERYPLSSSVRVSLKKLNPPLRGKVDYSSIVITI